MENIKVPRAIAQPRTDVVKLLNKFEFAITTGLWCPQCGDDIRAVDAEPLDNDGSVRLICRCGHQLLRYEWQP